MIEELRSTFEKQGFEVCTRVGNRMRVKPDQIRLFFIYTSFIGMGSPIILYLSMATALRIKDYFWARKTSVFDL